MEPTTPSARRFTTTQGAQKVSTSKSLRSSSVSHTWPCRSSSAARPLGLALISTGRARCAASSSVCSCGVIAILLVLGQPADLQVGVSAMLFETQAALVDADLGVFRQRVQPPDNFLFCHHR